MVQNQTYTCFYPRQELQVSLMANGWLHTGSLVCPPCEEVCGEEFAQRGEKCRTGEIVPRDFSYYEDQLVCGVCQRKNSIFLTIFSLFVALVVIKS